MPSQPLPLTQTAVASTGPGQIITAGSYTLTLDPPEHKQDGMLVKMKRAEIPPTDDQALWAAIRNSTNALGFNSYRDFIDPLMSDKTPATKHGGAVKGHFDSTQKKNGSSPFPHVDGYKLLQIATDVFLSVQTGAYTDLDLLPEQFESDLADERRRFDRTVSKGEIKSMWTKYLTPASGFDQTKMLPYLELIQSKLGEIPLRGSNNLGDATYGILKEKLTRPLFLELIWSYWHEEGMLVQSMNAISLRFQNVRTSDRDPLAQFEVDPLRPLNNLLWGYIQSEQFRLTLPRRAYEYDHQYGMTIEGKAVPALRSAESRSQFLEAFHNLLTSAYSFIQDDDQTTIVADGFPVLNALKDVHMLLTQGMHNQYGDLQWTARQEMLMQQWLLARPEIREFIPARVMVAYPEPWMDRVDAMKRLQGWNDVPINHFRDLGVFGEQLLLSIRFGAWSTIIEPQSAANWVRYWRSEIQGYIYSYRAVTGIDLSSEVVDTRQAAERYLPPAIHINKRLRANATRGTLPQYRKSTNHVAVVESVKSVRR